MRKIILVSNLNEDMIKNGYSVEAGYADNIKHFDHHNQWGCYNSPCNNEDIAVSDDDSTIYVTHIDADTFCGILRLCGNELSSEINTNLMEQIDLNGSSIIKDKFDKTLCYMEGISQISKEIGIPRASIEPIDITDKLEQMVSISLKRYVDKGYEAQIVSESTYKNCKVDEDGKVVLFSINENQPLDPSRPYEDGYDVVVVYRSNYKSTSIYCSPDSNYKFGGTVVAGIKFEGHDKACGTPRGIDWKFEDAEAVFKDVSQKVKESDISKEKDDDFEL